MCGSSGEDLLDPVQDRSGDAYRADGVLVNTFLELEKGAFKVFEEDEISGFPVYLIGPLIQTGLSMMGTNLSV